MPLVLDYNILLPKYIICCSTMAISDKSLEEFKKTFPKKSGEEWTDDEARGEQQVASLNYMHKVVI